MSFSRNPREPVPEIDTEVWACTNEKCSSWMRKSYSFDDKPTCPICEATMDLEVRKLPELK